MQLHFKGLRTAGYKVGDIIKAKEWYSRILGIEPYFDEPFYVGFNVGGYELGLQPDDSQATQKDASVVAYWGVDDVMTTYHDLLKAGATPHEEPTEVGDEIMVATVKDPWGNAFGIICNPHFKVG